ncbi:HD-GYP domain-containing protein [Bacillus sp. AFS055030]|uniref:HD-GYP domain-containing protein n=1 Tax=Bacillus sp. AFS055030 TaxID=2033507 RepID=UPI000BFD52E0|nr:HD-GYP domain-containing protein [Bacillus sp. AFS055030]PGL71374.1 diguanylate cyclase [Bacillus sp. AFS055030]
MFYKWFNNPAYFRYVFYITFVLSIVLNLICSEKSDSFYFLYMLDTVIFGLGFYNYPICFIILVSTIIMLSRYYLVPQSGYIISYLITYYLITYISVGLMKHYQRVKTGSIELILALSNALDSRDNYTAHHSECVANMAYKIAKKMKLSNSLCGVIHQGGLLHDIGKIGIPEHILLKDDKLTEDEYNTIKKHPVIGYDIIKHIDIFNENGILDIVLYHHERYDGKGYPEGLKGNQIPLTARIVAIADSYDAMISNRLYRKGMSLEDCLKEIENNKGIQFDPEITDVFLSLFED